MSVQEIPKKVEPAPVRPGWARSRLHAVLGISGPVVGLLAALIVYRLGWSLLASVITFAAVAGMVALALPEALLGPRRVGRVVFALVPVAASVVGFVVAARVWEPTWLPLIAGGVAGSALGGALQRAMFPGLAREREARWSRRGPGPEPA